ncbi:MAG: hypothetical protein R3C12_15275 [Planctomycetaceae bacterium]
MVQTLPLVGVLKKKYPQAEIDWVIRSELANLLAAEPRLAEIIPYHRKEAGGNGCVCWGDCGAGNTISCSMRRDCCVPR